MTVWILPLEPLDERYTEDWYSLIPQEFGKRFDNVRMLKGERLEQKIETGRFLDVHGTIHWKMTQMADVARLFKARAVKDGDAFFECDIWRPGLESIRYMSALSGLKVYLFGIAHAGTYDPHDFTTQAGLSYIGEYCEKSWIACCDLVFVSVPFHKRLIQDTHKAVPDWKLSVTGLPHYPSRIRDAYKNTYGDFVPVEGRSNAVVFPHRLDPEKRPYLFDRILEYVKQYVPNVEGFKSRSKPRTKLEYYGLLGQSKVAVSFALQETFGYGMLEAEACGCHVVVPDTLAYQDIYEGNHRYPIYAEYASLYDWDEYTVIESAGKLVVSALKNPESTNSGDQFEGALSRMADRMEEVMDDG